MPIDLDNANLRIWDYVDAWYPGACMDHRTVDYKSKGIAQRLDERIADLVSGEARRFEFHPDASTNQIIVAEDIAYTRLPNALALTQTKVISWYDHEGAVHPLTKTLFKTYSPLEQMREGTRRRTNVIDQLAIEVLGMIAALRTAGDLGAAEAIGTPYFAKHKQLIDIYIPTGDGASIQTAVAADAGSPAAGEEFLNDDLTPLGIPGVSVADYIIAAVAPIVV